MKLMNCLTTITKLVWVLMFVSLVVPCISASADGKITLQALLTNDTIRVRDLKELDLNVKEGHGPVLWASLNDKIEVWFWCKPGILSVLGMGKIILIATVDSNDENHGTIIWPKDKIGRDYGEELKNLYKK